MRDLSFAAFFGFVAIWLLLYVNEQGTETASPSGVAVYAAALLCPSACFWLFAWAGGRLPGNGKGDRLLLFTCATATVVAVCSRILLTLLSQPPAQRPRPIVFSGLTAAYACSFALIVAALIRLPGVKQRILQGNLLGWLAVGGALGGFLGFWAAKLLAGKQAFSLGAFTSLVLVSGFLVALLLASLCLLSMSRTQTMLGVAALASLALLLVFSRFELFFSIWLEGTFFWPFVILCCLCVEAVAFRILLSNFFSRVVGVGGV
jgi:hypothetical protein